MELTDRQSEALEFIVDCWCDGYLPTVKEIVVECGFSVNAVNDIIVQLIEKDMLKKRNTGRGFGVTTRARKLHNITLQIEGLI